VARWKPDGEEGGRPWREVGDKDHSDWIAGWFRAGFGVENQLSTGQSLEVGATVRRREKRIEGKKGSGRSWSDGLSDGGHHRKVDDSRPWPGAFQPTPPTPLGVRSSSRQRSAMGTVLNATEEALGEAGVSSRQFDTHDGRAPEIL